MSRPEGEVSGGLEVWPQDHDRDVRTEGGDRLSGRGHGGHREVLLEVRTEGQEVIDISLLRPIFNPPKTPQPVRFPAAFKYIQTELQLSIITAGTGVLRCAL